MKNIIDHNKIKNKLKILPTATYLCTRYPILLETFN